MSYAIYNLEKKIVPKNNQSLRIRLGLSLSYLKFFESLDLKT